MSTIKRRRPTLRLNLWSKPRIRAWVNFKLWKLYTNQDARITTAKKLKRHKSSWTLQAFKNFLGLCQNKWEMWCRTP